MYYFVPYTQFYVLNRDFRQKQVSVADLAIVAKDGLFLPSFVTSTQFDLWRHAKVGLLAWWRYIRRLFLHAQIVVRPIFTIE